MPQWSPGKKDGKNVEVYYSIPIQIEFKKRVFKLLRKKR